MKMFRVRVTTTVRPIARLSLDARPNLLIEDEVRNPFIFFEFFKYLGTVNTCLWIVGQVYC